jgi:ribonuclease BN (tRNA processing enzyme)
LKLCLPICSLDGREKTLMANSETIILYVDVLDAGGFISFTEDVSKIQRNIDSMGSEIAQNFEIQMALSREYVYGINCIGDYLCITHFHKDEKGGYMGFIKDRWYKTDEEIESFLLLNRGLSEEQVVAFMRNYRGSSLRLRPSSDSVLLSL